MASPSVFKGRLALILLAILFIGPLVAAYLSYYGGWRPGGQVHQGHLVEPVQSLPAMTLYDAAGQALEEDMLHGPRWTMLYVGSSNCEDVCKKSLYRMRQVWKSLHRRSKRVQGVYIATDRSQQAALESFLEEEHKGLRLGYAHAGKQSGRPEALETVLQGGGAEIPAGTVYLIDPLGNWMLYYTPDDAPKGMLKDIKKLLRLSNIG